MGMSASQARLLSLQARQSNLEYQGQQINQERSILSQQCTALYNSLLAMTVPTPPSTSDFTKVQYTAKQGATSWTFDAGSIRPESGDTHIVTLGRSEYGITLEKSSTALAVKDDQEPMKGQVLTAGTYKTAVETVKTGGYVKGETTDNTLVKGYMDEADDATNPDTYVLVMEDDNAEDGAQGGTFVKFDPATMLDGEENGWHFADDGKGNIQLFTFSKEKPASGEEGKDYYSVYEDTFTTGGEDTPITEDVLKDLYVFEPDGSVRKADAKKDLKRGTDGKLYLDPAPGKMYFLEGCGTEEATMKTTAGEEKHYQIGGFNAYTFEDAVANGSLDATAVEKYKEAIKHANIEVDGNKLTEDDFYVFFDGDGNIHFAQKGDVQSPDRKTEVYNFAANGLYTEKEVKNGCKIDFDGGTGRITSIQIPTSYDENGVPLSYTTMEVTAEKVTDEHAYQDAYNQYEYAQYEYDKMNQDINRKTEIIQQEDRNLELKLQRLDNERTQIKTEIDAVEKVINENIEKSYKTFSG